MTTVATARADIRSQIGDTKVAVYSDVDINNAISRAVRSAWPSFATLIRDDTTYCAPNSIAVNTISVAVPAAFLPSGARSAGKISSLWVRESTLAPGQSEVSGTAYPAWFRLRKGVRIDDLGSSPTPRIWFSLPYATYCELKIYGGQPLNITLTGNAGTDDALVVDTGQDAGYLEYLLWRTIAYLEASRQMAGPEDPAGHAQRRIMAQDEAEKARTRFGGQWYFDTSFNYRG